MDEKMDDSDLALEQAIGKIDSGDDLSSGSDRETETPAPVHRHVWAPPPPGRESEAEVLGVAREEGESCATQLCCNSNKKQASITTVCKIQIYIHLSIDNNDMCTDDHVLLSERR